MQVFAINDDAGYCGCGRAWAAVKDGRVVAIKYMARHSAFTADGCADNYGGRTFEEYRTASRRELDNLGDVFSGEASCWEFCS
jgi:hypothetical protein